MFDHADSGLDLELRKNGLTGSDVAAICGVHPYRTPWDVYASKRGLVTESVKENEAMELGTVFQLAVLHVYQKRTGNPVRWFDKTITHRTKPWIVCTPDGLQEQPRLDGAEGIYEGKTAGHSQLYKWGPSWSDEYPDQYGIQCVWNVIGTERHWAHMAVLLGAESLQVRLYEVEPSATYRRELEQRAWQFWQDHVVAGKAPEIEASTLADVWLKKQQMLRETLVEPDEETLALIEELASIKASAAGHKERQADLEAKLKARIGENAGFSWGAGKLTWKPTKGKTVTDHESLAKELLDARSPEEAKALIAKHTTTEPGVRRFVLTVKGGRE